MEIKGLKSNQTQLQKDLARGYVDNKYMQGAINTEILRQMNPHDSEKDISRMMSLIQGRAHVNNEFEDLNSK